MNKIIIFTGAGMSYPLGLPITTEFTKIIEKIPDKIKIYLERYLQEDFKDIEKIMSTLESFIDQHDFLTTIIDQEIQLGYFQQTRSFLDDARDTCHHVLTGLKDSIYDILNKFEEEKAAKLYTSLIKQIKDRSSEKTAISFFTTNYDLSFEKTLYLSLKKYTDLNIKSVDFGFVDNMISQNYTSNQDFIWDPNTIEYIKLHGSLDWQEDELMGCVRTGTCIKPIDPNETPLLYPGFKGVPQKEPFISFHKRFENRIDNCDAIVVIGFAFRDEYLNSIFEFFLKTTGKKIYCFNPCNLEDFPEESKVPFFTEEYTNFLLINKEVKIKNNPLDFNF